MQGIDNDLHGTPAFLQNASVDPNHKKHIDPEVEMEIFYPFRFSNITPHQPRDNPIWIILKVEKQCIALNISIYNNLAACLLQLKDSKAERIKEVTEVVIELDSSNEKAWFRQVLEFVDWISSYLDEFP